MLSFKVQNAGTVASKGIQIYCDAEGMSVLLHALAQMIGERSGHTHLCGPSAGGSELNEIDPWGEQTVWEVVIDYDEGC